MSRAGEAGTRAAVEALRAAIANGDIAPGQRLIEPELADLFGVSRASARAALMALTGEGLVERIPNRGARVRVISVDEAVAITECRMVLEALCARKTAERVTPSQVEMLVALGESMTAAVEDGDAVKYSAHNRRLHGLLSEIAAQPVAEDLLQRLQGKLVRHQFRLALRPGRARTSLPQHLAIIDAIAARDPDAAAAAATAHLQSVIEALRTSEPALP